LFSIMCRSAFMNIKINCAFAKIFNSHSTHSLPCLLRRNSILQRPNRSIAMQLWVDVNESHNQFGWLRINLKLNAWCQMISVLLTFSGNPKIHLQKVYIFILK
jgi:hypothetical protein